MTIVKTPPLGDHFAIVIFDSMRYSSGYEKDGGYDSERHYHEYYAFEGDNAEQRWKDEIRRLQLQHPSKTFFAIRAALAKVTTEVKVVIE